MKEGGGQVHRGILLVSKTKKILKQPFQSHGTRMGDALRNEKIWNKYA